MVPLILPDPRIPGRIFLALMLGGVYKGGMTYVHNIKPALVAPLTDILRELKQAVGVLCSVETDGSNCYCFEGALCELYRRMTGNGKWAPDYYVSLRMSFYCGSGESSTLACPDTVSRWATVDDEVYLLANAKRGVGFASLNDDGKTFEDLITILHTKVDAE